MREGISMKARREIVRALAVEYAKASKGEKSVILDHVCTAMGWSRANARRRLVAAGKARAGPTPLPRRRQRKYGPESRAVLERVWTLSGEPCGKYLAVVMEDHLERFERFGELAELAGLLDDTVRGELSSMSGATIDRYLAPLRKARYPAASLSSTRPGAMLRSEIPVRWSGTPMEQEPGFFETDTVAHCGHSLFGEDLRTITLTDVFTGWTANTAVRNRAHRNVLAGVAGLADALPYPMRGLDFDNGGEFVNVPLTGWARGRGIELTRARPYRHNDNAHVEQRNRDWVRRHAFRYRYEGPEELELLQQLWVLVDARNNHLLPMVKAKDHTTSSSGRRRRTYDKPRTAYQRLLDAGAMDEENARALAEIHRELNPAAITRGINAIQNQLINRARLRTQHDGTTATRAK
ncbi:integrase catalytic domain-containing protein [Zafaria sp. J156]|uniref:integrase n=1 Tax=Zafaria sp. J156 TaxID=3116490 RepID=UPI002E78B882|nr:integrase [Zafaria sp. J156]MEE1620493.1 integrase [Zafaria sp. J156]